MSEKNANDTHTDVTFLHSNILNIKRANVEAKRSTSEKRLTSHWTGFFSLIDTNLCGL